jgi:uncharacterized protein HemX
MQRRHTATQFAFGRTAAALLFAVSAAVVVWYFGKGDKDNTKDDTNESDNNINTSQQQTRPIRSTLNTNEVLIQGLIIGMSA